MIGPDGSKEYQEHADELVGISAGLTDRQKMIAEYWSDGPYWRFCSLTTWANSQRVKSGYDNCHSMRSRRKVKILLILDFPLSGLINETKVYLRYCLHPCSLADLLGR